MSDDRVTYLEIDTDSEIPAENPKILLFDDDGKKKSQATLMIEIAGAAELFHDADDRGFGIIDVNNHS